MTVYMKNFGDLPFLSVNGSLLEEMGLKHNGFLHDVIDKEKFFLAVIKYGIRFEEIKYESFCDME